jgi:hypothetical protein
MIRCNPQRDCRCGPRVLFLFLHSPTLQDFFFSGFLHCFFSRVSSHVILSAQWRCSVPLNVRYSSVPVYSLQCVTSPVSVALSGNLIQISQQSLIPAWFRDDTMIRSRPARSIRRPPRERPDSFQPSSAYLPGCRVHPGITS